MHETGRVPNPAEVADRLAIHDVLACHSRGIDRADSAILKSAYWPDAVVFYGAFEGAAHVFCERMPEMMRANRATHHAIGNVSIEFDRDVARVETYVVAGHYIPGDDGDREMTFFGRYLDRMQRRGDVWKIVERRVVMDWNRLAPASAHWDGTLAKTLLRGTRGRDDPAYGHLEG
jgi:hypothetical protein